MKCHALRVFAVLGLLGCAGEEPAPESRQQLATAGETFKIGVLVAASSPAAASFVAAAHLVESQLNQGLQSAGSPNRFDVVVASYADGQAVNAALDLINNQGVLAIAGDTDDTTSQVNQLNHDFDPQTTHKVPVTCYQCSSPRFNDVGDTQPGYADPDGWLFRTFFNRNFESAVQARLVLGRPRKGDFNQDGRLDLVVVFDFAHLTEAFNLPAYLDSLHQGPHAVHFVLHGTGVGQPPMPQEIDEIFAAAPDAVVLDLSAPSVAPVLSAFNAHPGAHPPVQANDEVRRDHWLPSLLAAGGASLEGPSVLRVSDSPSGAQFRSAFTKATGRQPEVTAAFLYDAVAVPALAISWSFHFGSLDPQVIQGNVFNVNDPTGMTIRARPADLAAAFQRIDLERPINYEGAGSPQDLDFLGESFPDLVHWNIQDGKFGELESYRCDPQTPSCARR